MTDTDVFRIKSAYKCPAVTFKKSDGAVANLLDETIFSNFF